METKRFSSADLASGMPTPSNAPKSTDFKKEQSQAKKEAAKVESNSGKRVGGTVAAAVGGAVVGASSVLAGQRLGSMGGSEEMEEQDLLSKDLPLNDTVEEEPQEEVEQEVEQDPVEEQSAAQVNINININTTAAPTPEPVVEPEPVEIGDVEVATGVDDSMSFNEAFAAARHEVGAGGVFEWHGNTYNTYYKEEWDLMSADERNEFMAEANHATDNFTGTAVVEPEPVAEPVSLAADPIELDLNDDGMTDVVALDTNEDGMHDAAIIDLNADGEADVVIAANAEGTSDAFVLDVDNVYVAEAEPEDSSLWEDEIAEAEPEIEDEYAADGFNEDEMDSFDDFAQDDMDLGTDLV